MPAKPACVIESLTTRGQASAVTHRTERTRACFLAVVDCRIGARAAVVREHGRATAASPQPTNLAMTIGGCSRVVSFG
jgi:hypothetical protein